jgi:preprotein translocase subunit SecE
VSQNIQPGAVAGEGASSAAASSAPQTQTSGAGRRGGRGSLFSRIRRYYRETVSELRKVIYPTRSELLNYTAVVLVFVSVMVAAVFGLDVLFAKFDLFLFGK